MFRQLSNRLCLRSFCLLGFAVMTSVLDATFVVAQNQQPAVRDTIIVSSGFDRRVGGVSVNVDGVLNNIDPLGRRELSDARRKALDRVPQAMAGATELRMISLRQLNDALAEHAKQSKPIDDEMRYLAGLQRVQYIFVDPDNNDIVLAGPAEGWKVDDLGYVVGVTTGRPVIQLEDLLVALRTANAARNGGISCSIDPTPDGLTRLQQYLSSKQTIGNAKQTLSEIEQTLGPQNITVEGVPADSRFANVLVAADYRMKRLAMKMDDSPVKGLPSYLDMATPGGTATPRWWLSPNYEALHRDQEGLAWEIHGVGVKCETAEDTFDATGQRAATAKGSPLAQKWADMMTAKYEELAAKEPVFGELRNCIDLAVVSALILKENLAERAGCKLTALLNEKEVPVGEYPVPKQVDSRATAVKKGRNWVIQASGGVMIQPWDVVQSAQTSDKVAPVRTKAVAQRKTAWWWN